MAIDKKSLVSKAPATTSTKSRKTAAKPITSGKMVPSMRLAKASLKASKGSITTAFSRNFV
jgi:hypothetical protein